MFRSVLAAALAGVFSLAGGTPHVAASLSEDVAGSVTRLAFSQVDASTHQPILRYDVDRSNLLHMIVVRDDLQTFEHLHPHFDASTGRFAVDVPASPLHRYYVYADSHPHGSGQQVFRFLIHARAPAAPRRAFGPSAKSVMVSGYRVTLGTTRLPARRASRLDVRISQSGHDAQGLRPYLGAPAHVVLIDAVSLQYAHVHPSLFGAPADMEMPMDQMAMPDAKEAGPHLTANVPALPPGTYRMWLQFAGPDAAVHTAAFTLVLN